MDAFYPVAHTPIGRIGTIVCMDGSFPETARGLAMNGAEIIYRPSYPEPSVGSGLWEVQNRARALDNNCYVIAPNLASYHITPNSPAPIDCFGGQTMIIDYHGQILCEHTYGGSASYAAATIDIQTLRDFRVRSVGTNWLKELRTEQYQLIYDQPIYPKNLRLTQAPPGHAAHEQLRRGLIEELVERGTWAPPPRDPETP
ncbi:nitrilase-related carbon-nitrogen hydrolase [Nocardia sp. CA-128927]|uniref:nitrilase-related carbon-nitrogen hydrolase n=1 Tax=Nocardia sp. CA-128927 TaxID=3239975 RepID=UPI003D96860E